MLAQLPLAHRHVRYIRGSLQASTYSQTRFLVLPRMPVRGLGNLGPGLDFDTEHASITARRPDGGVLVQYPCRVVQLPADSALPW
jgi:hypothetical protein